jgi:hypothetical protein
MPMDMSGNGKMRCKQNFFLNANLTCMKYISLLKARFWRHSNTVMKFITPKLYSTTSALKESYCVVQSLHMVCRKCQSINVG